MRDAARISMWAVPVQTVTTPPQGVAVSGTSFEKLPKSDQVDEVVYGIGRRAMK